MAAVHLLARHGGDEFMLLLEDLPGDGRAVARRSPPSCWRSSRLPFRLAGAGCRSARASASACPGRRARRDDLLKHADAAMYQAKRGGPRPHRALRRRRRAPRRAGSSSRAGCAARSPASELELHYQPVYALATARSSASEALVRWNDPERGMVSPGEFIPLAEDTGLIEADRRLGARRRPAARRAAWRDAGPASSTVGFNASPLELVSRGFARPRARAPCARTASLRDAVDGRSSSPRSAEPERRRRAARAHRALGVRVAIDDFGADYSSLARLRDLTVDDLKIDRSFLRGVPEDERGGRDRRRDRCAWLGARAEVVAEGVETAEQLEHPARRRGCDRGQGFHLARPMPAAELTECFRSTRAGAARRAGPA